MLDVHISMPCIKYNSSFRVLVPFRKPSSHWVSLRNDSMHTFHTHIAWPQAYLARLRALATTPSLQKEACKAFLAEVQAHDSQHPALRQSSNTSRKQVRGDFTFIVLPFFWHANPACLTSLAQKVYTYHSVPELKQPKIAWRLLGKHLGKTIKSYNRRMEKR